MKIIRYKFIGFSNTLLSLIITLLGFSLSCAKKYGSPEPVPMYGVSNPYAKFQVQGVVRSLDSNKVIKSIRVEMSSDTAFTDINGNFNLETFSTPQSHVFTLKFEDIDGNIYRQFFTLDTTVQFNSPVFTGGDGYNYYGYTEKQFNVKLIPYN